MRGTLFPNVNFRTRDLDFFTLNKHYCGVWKRGVFADKTDPKVKNNFFFILNIILRYRVEIKTSNTVCIFLSFFQNPKKKKEKFFPIDYTKDEKADLKNVSTVIAGLTILWPFLLLVQTSSNKFEFKNWTRLWKFSNSQLLMKKSYETHLCKKEKRQTSQGMFVQLKLTSDRA